MAVKLFPTLEAAEAHILKHELTYTVKYVSRKQEKSFTQPIDAEKLGKQGKRFIMRCPSIVIGVKVMQCQNGRDMAKKSKAKRMALSKKLADADHAYKRQTRDITQDTIKMDCPAMLKIKRIVRFPDYKLATGKESRRHKKSKLDQLRACKEPLRCEEVFQLTLPDVDCHSTHNVGKAGGMLQGIDGGVKAHIKLMVSQGVNFLSEMHPHLQQYIQQRFAGLPLPDRSNRRFWPTDKDITNHMQAAFTEILGSGGDQENCVRLVEEWKAQYPDDSFHFRPYQKDGARLLFVHQTEKQKHLMQRYGNELSCLDATYKTTKFSTYLFFIVVKTNVDYQIAATFITMDETTSAISEAVGMVKGWNPQWSPRAWMVDCAQSEISALEDLFPDAKVLLCKFHREQAWDRQLKRKEYGIGESLRQVILGSLRRLADARTEDRYLQEKRAMEGTNWWLDKANQRFIEYLQHQWMADDMPKRWVECYRLDRFLFSVNTNNGIERVNRYFKQNSLRYKTNNSLSRTLHILVTHTAPNKMKSYTVANDMCSSLRRKYGAKIPSYMHNRPKVMGQHCKKRLEEGRLMVEDTARLDDEDGRYTVQSQATADVYKVSLTEPSCECKDYQRSLYPCKHIYAVLFSEGKTFMDLPAAYVNSPWFQLDYKIMSLGSVISQPQPGEFGSKDHCEAEYPETEDAHVEMEMQGVETLDELPKPMRVQLTTASECRELLRQLTSLSYKVTDDQLLRDLCQSLHASIATLNSHCECGEDGLQKEPGTKTSGRYPARRKTVRKPVDSRRRRPARKISQRQQHVSKTTSQQASTSQLAQARTGLATSLLPRRRGPSALTGRVGIGADMRRPVAWPDIVSRGQKMVSMSEEHRIQSAISSAEEVSSAILDLDTIDPADDKRTDDALEALANPLHKLTGEDMERVSAILTKQWPDVTFQNPHYIQRPQMFSGVVKYGTEKYAQVIHMEDDEHWVAVTNLGCRGRVRLFDSAGLRPTFNVKSAVASLERSPSDKVVINVEAVQRQEGGIDCGLFAIANLVECLNSADPRKARYNQKKMRGHLITCLRSKQLSVFPKVEAPVVLPRTNTYSIQFKVYCKCRGPHQAKQLDESYNWMVQCGTCKEWYHRRCITLLATDIDPFTGKVADDYLCKRCKDQGKGLV